MSKTTKAKNIIHPAFYLTVDTDYGTNESTVTIVPNCNDKACKKYVMHFHKGLCKFRNKGIKESKAAFDEFIQVLKSAAPVWRDDRKAEDVMLNTFKRLSLYNDLTAVLYVNDKFDIERDTYPIHAAQANGNKQAQVTATIDYCDVIRPAYNPTLKIYNVDYTISVILRNDEDATAIYRMGHTFNGSMKIVRSDKASFVHLLELKVEAPDTIMRALGLRDVDTQALIVRAIAAGGKYVNDGQDFNDVIEVHSCAYSTLTEAFEKCEQAFHAWLDTRDEMHNIRKAS